MKIPKHIALIMDGNRRWAREHGKPVFEGHRIGEERIEPIIDESIRLGIKFLTFWAFSTENWKRDRKEVAFLLDLFRFVFHKKVNSFHKKNVRLNILGNIESFPKDLQKKMRSWMEKTKNNTSITVNIALSYGGRDEILRAVNKIIEMGLSNNNLQKIDMPFFEKNLDTAGQPDPDLLIRTGGEERLSGFMLWQLEYSEMYFTQVLWPNFTIKELNIALKEYTDRQRRFGK